MKIPTFASRHRGATASGDHHQLPELDWNHLGVGAKVGIGGEDLPPTSQRNTADQEINSRSKNAATTAFIAPVRRLFIISSRQIIRKGSQLLDAVFRIAQSLECRKAVLGELARSVEHDRLE